MQISDLRQAKKITFDKNCTVIEGQIKSELPIFGPGTCDFRLPVFRFTSTLE